MLKALQYKGAFVNLVFEFLEMDCCCYLAKNMAKPASVGG
jgi:hypothetical protein